LRDNIGTYLGDIPTGRQLAGLEPLKNEIGAALDREVGGYSANNSAYARLSQPINDIRAGQSLDGKIDWNSPDAFGNKGVNVSDLKQALRADDRQTFGMSDPARTKLENVLDSLNQARASNNTIAAPGNSSTAGDTAKMLKHLAPAGKSTLAMLLGGVGGHYAGVGDAGGALAGLVLQSIAKKGEPVIASKAAGKFANAEELARAIEIYQQQQNQRRIGNGVGKYLLPYRTQP